MALIEVTGQLQGEATAQALAGRCISVSATCRGRSAGGLGQQSVPDDEPQPEAKSPQGK